MDLIRVLVVASTVLMRTGLAGMLADQAGFDVVGTADATEPLRRCVQPPDVAVIYVDRTLSQGICGLIEQIKIQQPGIKVLVLSPHQKASTIASWVAAGVNAYLPRDLEPAGLAEAIRHVVHYGLLLSTEAARAVRSQLVFGTPVSLDSLTHRELEVVRAVAQGWSNRETAEVLHVSVNTVKTHLRNIYEKLGISSRTELITLSVLADL